MMMLLLLHNKMVNNMSETQNLSGILIKVTGGFYYVEAANSIYECKARGSFRNSGNSPLVGDRVEISIPKDGYCSIEKIFDRKNKLKRPPLANVDTLVIVCSTAEPLPNTLIIDKMTAAAVNNNMEPVIVVSKSDLGDSGPLAEIYRQAGFKVFEYSSDNLQSAMEIMPLLKNKITAFTGNTGVGKSTLLNLLFPKLNLETGVISQKLGRGKHTTRTVELFKAEGGYVADTPGFSTVDLARYEMIDKEQLQYCFPEFEEYLGKCQFTSCAHLCEKGCEILEAVKNGTIPKSRHESYKYMYNEVKDIKSWENK